MTSNGRSWHTATMPTNTRSTIICSMPGSPHPSPPRRSKSSPPLRMPSVSATPSIGRPRPSVARPSGVRGSAAGRSTVPPAVNRRVIVRRRRAVLSIVTAVVLLLLLGYGIAGADSAGPATVRSATDQRADAPRSAARVHVVRSGDTLWSIARAAQPTGDVRPLVERLSQQTGARVDVGMRVEVPS